MVDFPEKLRKKLLKRETEGALRSLAGNDNKVDFSSNDYLGFARNEALFAKTFQLLLKEGISQNGSTGSRLLSGNHRLYGRLEKDLAQFHKAESALVFNSGYDANIGFFSTVPKREDVVFYDELVHASIRDGIKLGNAKSYKFDHNSIDDLISCVERNRSIKETSGEVYIVTESVFSMDGDSPDLSALVNLCANNNYHLIVDEAHATGVMGNKGAGLVQHLNLHGEVFARIATFGKALGSHGAAILGSVELIDYLVNFSRSFIYTTGLTPHTLATIVSAYQFLDSAEEEQQRLLENISYFKQKLKTLELDPFFVPSDSPIQSCVIPGNEKVRCVSRKLGDEGFDIKAILAPTVPEGQERLRFCLHSFNTEGEITWVLQLLKKYL
ncbi:aminotransferase class I/II-fold pyridoxal phosphate-dependent enzyme [Maribacter algicola]|uniref:Aminotransferase class I/II-fold pyridoxal phosphate-dependent enzyme n=1 Tax=Meishania litoralis TaxID=3434685 RepID=A0ACC7LIH2_9FLAO